MISMPRDAEAQRLQDARVEALPEQHARPSARRRPAPGRTGSALPPAAAPRSNRRSCRPSPPPRARGSGCRSRCRGWARAGATTASTASAHSPPMAKRMNSAIRNGMLLHLRLDDGVHQGQQGDAEDGAQRRAPAHERRAGQRLPVMVFPGFRDIGEVALAGPAARSRASRRSDARARSGCRTTASSRHSHRPLRSASACANSACARPEPRKAGSA